VKILKVRCTSKREPRENSCPGEKKGGQDVDKVIVCRIGQV
jgi:hypothetical protein